MSFGIIDLNVIPVRLKDSAKSEMISQFFFGETLTVLNKSETWSLNHKKKFFHQMKLN